MKILGIETSCDETAVCVIDGTGDTTNFHYELLGNALFSQIEIHKEYGGVFPNLAKREHAKNLVPLLTDALQQSNLLVPAQKPQVSKEIIEVIKELLVREPGLFAQLVMFFAQYEKPEIDVLAVTHGPGLEPALWVGVNFARALSIAWNIPIVPINHMEGHIVISAMREHSLSQANFPALAFLISGGHTELVVMPQWFEYQKVGETRDDAIGEAFDKVARLLGLPYPGGPEISKLASVARKEDIASPFTLTRPMLQSGDLDFSFSGIKTAVRNEIEKIGQLSESHKKGIAREFEDAVTDVCIFKVKKAIEEYGIRTLVVGGGVAANTNIKEALQTLTNKTEVEFLICPPIQATDNALMIALAGYFRAQKGDSIDQENLKADGNLSLS